MEIKEKRRRLDGQCITHTTAVPSTSLKGLGTMAIHMEDLPDGLLLRILDLLPDTDLIETVPYVCLRWRRLGLDSQIWNNRTYTLWWEDSDSAAVEFFSMKPALQDVEFQREVGDDVLLSLASHCPTITSLNLEVQDRLTLDTLRAITRNCDQIRDLRVTSEALACRDCAREVALMPSLETLYVLGEASLQLRELGTGCAKLRSLVLLVNKVPLGDLGAQLLRRLQELTISWNSVSRDIAHCAESLEKLALCNYGDCSRPDSDLAEDLLPLKALTDVDVRNLLAGPQVFRALMQPLLRSLDLSDYTTLTDDLLVDLCGHCPLLEDLNLTKCCLITAQGLSSMWRLGQLRRLCLSRCEGLGSGAITHLARCDGLQELSIEGVDMECMVSELLPLRKLRVLAFNAWSARDLIPWEMFHKAFPDLRTLHLGLWKSLDTSRLESLKAAMPKVYVTWLVYWQQQYHFKD